MIFEALMIVLLVAPFVLAYVAFRAARRSSRRRAVLAGVAAVLVLIFIGAMSAFLVQGGSSIRVVSGTSHLVHHRGGAR